MDALACGVWFYRTCVFLVPQSGLWRLITACSGRSECSGAFVEWMQIAVHKSYIDKQGATTLALLPKTDRGMGCICKRGLHRPTILPNL